MTLYGLDVSSNNAGLDLASVKAQGYTFVTARLLSFPGGDAMVMDSSFGVFRDAARANGLLFAAYILPHTFFTPDEIAHYAMTHIGDDTIPIMIDWESDGTSQPNLKYATNLYDELELVGLNPQTLYAPHWYWQNNQGSPALNVRPWKLVGSNYGPNLPGTASAMYPGDTSARWAGYGSLPMSILQFGSTIQVTGYKGNLDGDAFRGTLAQLQATNMFTDWTPQSQGDDVATIDTVTPEAAQTIGDAVATSIVRRELGGAGYNGNLAQYLVDVRATLLDVQALLQQLAPKQ